MGNNEELFWKKVKERDGNTHAVSFLEEGVIITKTYEELRNDIDTMSRFLKDNKICGRIGLSGASSYLLLVSFLAIESLGYTAVCVPTLEDDPELVPLLGRLGVRDVICNNVIDHQETQINSIIQEVKRVQISDASEYSAIYGEGVILLTSGTMGRKKPVVLSFEGMILDAFNSALMAGCVAKSKRLYTLLPFYHAFGLTGAVLICIWEGIEICLGSNSMKMMEDISLFKPEVILAVPQMVKALNSYYRITKKKMEENLKYIVVGGAKLEVSLIDDMLEKGVKCLEGYGITECSPVIAMNNPDRIVKGSVGRPLKDIEIRIHNGEIQVKGETVFLGYALVDNEKEKVMEDGYFCTGDMGTIDDEGFLFVTGRIKDLIVLQTGENVLVTALEEKISQIPNVSDVFVYEKKKGVSGVITAAIFTLAKTDEEYDQIAEKVRLMDGLMPFERIGRIEISDKPFLRTEIGKLKRNQDFNIIYERGISNA